MYFRFHKSKAAQGNSVSGIDKSQFWRLRCGGALHIFGWCFGVLNLNRNLNRNPNEPMLVGLIKANSDYRLHDGD
jgi:hypothetical protein